MLNRNHEVWTLYADLYVGDAGAQSILHPGHQVVGLLLCETLGGCRRKESRRVRTTGMASVLLHCSDMKEEQTRLVVLKLLLLVVINHNIRLH